MTIGRMFELDCFYEKNLVLDLRGFSVLFSRFSAFLQNDSKDLHNFSYYCKGHGQYCMSQAAFLRGFWSKNDKVLSVKECCFGGFPPKWCYDWSILACLLLKWDDSFFSNF